MRGVTLALLGLLACAPAIGCARGPEVVRVVDGRLVGGAYVEPEAYAAFLRGAIAEEHGQLGAALAAYTETVDKDSGDPEVWTRVGDVRCKLNPSDAAADHAIAKALAIDSEYAPAWEARARCATLRGASAASVDAWRRAASADPLAVEPQLSIARAEDQRVATAAVRDRLLALTLVHRGSMAAWDALAAWARVHDDPMLMAWALAEAVRHAPGRRQITANRALDLAGDGELLAARTVAGAALDVDGPHPPAAAARLAIDEAIAAGDVERVRVRATRAHLGLDEVGGRALLMGAPEMARALAEPLVQADPRAAGARMVLAAAGTVRTFDSARGALGPVPFVALAPFAAALADAAGFATARRFTEGLAHTAVDAGDSIVTRAAVDLAARGVLSESDLPMDARIELAARRREAPPVPRPGEVDARHRLLALALLRPTDTETLALARRLAGAAGRDALVAAAVAKIALARGLTLDARETGRLNEMGPRDAICAAAALDVANKQGDQRAILPARARLTALARTAAERAMVGE